MSEYDALVEQARAHAADPDTAWDDTPGRGFLIRLPLVERRRWQVRVNPRRYRWHLSVAFGPPLGPDTGRPLTDYEGRAWTLYGAQKGAEAAITQHTAPDAYHAAAAHVHARRAVRAHLAALAACAAAGLVLLLDWWWPWVALMSAAVAASAWGVRESRQRRRHSRARDDLA